MGKFEEKLETYKSEIQKLGLNYNEALLAAVSKGLGPSIYIDDAEKVASSDESELMTVKKNFLIKKLGLEDSPALDEAINKVVEQMGKSNRNKYRAIFYYLLVIAFKKESVYDL